MTPSAVGVTTLADLKALTSLPSAVITQCRSTIGDQGGGVWGFHTGDQSANITADPLSAVWAARDSDPTGATGAWRRQDDSVLWDSFFGAGPALSSATNSAALQALIDYCSATGRPGRIRPGVYQVDVTLIMKDGVRLYGAGDFNRARTTYAYADTNPTVIQGDGITGTNSVVFRCSKAAVGVDGLDLRDIEVQNIHFDANGAEYAAYYYRCGNEGLVQRVSHSGATVAGFFMAGIFSANGWELSTMINTGKGFIIGTNTADTSLSVGEITLNTVSAMIYTSRNDGGGGEGTISRGCYFRVISENNGAEAITIHVGAATFLGVASATWHLAYMEGNTSGPVIDGYAPASLSTEIIFDFRHPGSGTIVYLPVTYGDDNTTVFTVTGAAGITAANLYVYVDGVQQTPTTDYTVADNGADLDVTFVSAPASYERIAIHGNTTTTLKPQVLTIEATSTDNGASDTSNWLRIRGLTQSTTGNFINSNTFRYYVDGDGRNDLLSGTQFIFRAPEWEFVHADFSEVDRLINGTFRVNQRNASSGWADDTYGPDRWYALTQTDTITYTELTPGETGQVSAARLTQAQASAQRMGIAQIIETDNCRDLRSTLCNFQARIRCSSSQAIRYAILEWTGASNVVTSDVVNDWTSAQFRPGGFFNSTTLAVVRTGRVVPSANTWTNFSSGTIRFAPGASTVNLIVMIWTEGTAAQNVTLDIGEVSLKRGGQRVNSEPPSVGQEFKNCLRYYWQAVETETGKTIGAGHCTSETAASVLVGAPAAMRTVPTMTLSDVAHFAVTDASGAAITTSNLTLSNATQWHALLAATTASGLAAGNGTLLSSNNASASLALDAEL